MRIKKTPERLDGGGRAWEGERQPPGDEGAGRPFSPTIASTLAVDRDYDGRMAHLQVVVLGGSPDGEVWSNSFRFSQRAQASMLPTPGRNDITDAETLQTVANEVAALQTGNVYPPALRAGLSASLSIYGVRVNAIGDNGAMLAAAEHVKATPVQGSGSATRPLQVACCVTLNAGAAFGRHYRGRVFVPALAGPAISAATLRVSPTDRQNLASALATLLSEVGGVINAQSVFVPPFVPVVYSRATGQLLAVQNISVGDVLDTQRRRRDSLRENRTLLLVE